MLKSFLSRLCGAAALAVALSGTALAHHGWSWAEDKNSELTGVIVTATLGNPHGMLTLDVKGERWVVELGQPWRNERAGLKDEMLVKGVALQLEGHRERDSKKKVFKAERVIINGKLFNLYPDRN